MIDTVNTPLWELKNISKEFPGVKALDKLNLKIYPGEIHGLLGENGCGKSTTIKCLSGVHIPSEGEMYYKGEKVIIDTPHKSRELGVATIFQEFSLVPTLSVAENIFLGRLPKKNNAVDWKIMREKAKNILAEIGLEINPDEIISNLSVAQQQMIEIAKALSMKAELLIMDEPTAALGMAEIKKLHKLIKQLAQQGSAIIYISHRLDEVEQLVDKMTVLRNGVKVAEAEKEDITVSNIVTAMIGSDVKEHYPKQKHSTDDVLLRVKDIHSDNGVNGASFTVKRGEVLGLAGLIGSGRTEIAHALFGIDKVSSGKIELEGIPLSFRRPSFVSPGEAIKYGVALITENRKYNGLFFNFKGASNISISKLGKLRRKLLMNLKYENEIAKSYVKKLQISPNSLLTTIGNLSGGNQQKSDYCQVVILSGRTVYLG